MVCKPTSHGGTDFLRCYTIFFFYWGDPRHDGFARENPVNMDDLGVAPMTSETSICSQKIPCTHYLRQIMGLRTHHYHHM